MAHRLTDCPKPQKGAMSHDMAPSIKINRIKYCYLIAAAAVLNEVFILAPSVVAPPTITMPIRAQIRAYSMAAAPYSLLAKRVKNFDMYYLLFSLVGLRLDITTDVIGPVLRQLFADI